MLVQSILKERLLNVTFNDSKTWRKSYVLRGAQYGRRMKELQRGSDKLSEVRELRQFRKRSRVYPKEENLQRISRRKVLGLTML